MGAHFVSLANRQLNNPSLLTKGRAALWKRRRNDHHASKVGVRNYLSPPNRTTIVRCAVSFKGEKTEIISASNSVLSVTTFDGSPAFFAPAATATLWTL